MALYGQETKTRRLFVIMDFSESGKDSVVGVIEAEDEAEAERIFCDNTIAEHADFSDGPLLAHEPTMVIMGE